MKKTKHVINVNCPDNILIYSNPGSFSHIITNFVTNALVHAFEEKEEGTMTIDVAIENNELVIKFSDNGKGIPEEHIKSIFDPFFTTKRTGTGLGLTIVHGILSALAGQIGVESKVGLGTNIKLVLNPLSADEREENVRENRKENLVHAG